MGFLSLAFTPLFSVAGAVALPARSQRVRRTAVLGGMVVPTAFGVAMRVAELVR